MNEFELIDLLTKDAPREASGLREGVGDDCAVIEGKDQDWLVTTDALFEDVHFSLDHTTARFLGRKSLSVNLSDIAAMGGEPLYYTVGLGVPKDFPVAHLEELYGGLKEVGKESGTLLIGGDTCASRSGLVLSVTVVGRAEKGRAISRRGAKDGDAVYVTGTFGDSALGLECLRRGKTGGKYAPFVLRHNDPKAKIGMGSWLANTKMVSSMIDVSDGLLADLSHIADSSRAGFEIAADSVPVSKGLAEVARELGLSAGELALTGGEDYELIFTVKGDRIQDFSAVFPVMRIGTIVGNAGRRVVLDEKGGLVKLSKGGFDHFA